jgi:hypothetical protein
MNEQDLCMCEVGADQARPLPGPAERPMRICVVFDGEESAKSAEVLIKHVASGYEYDKQSFSFDELDSPAPGVAAARSASDSDLFIFAVHDDLMVPRHVKSWLRLCIGLRDEDQDGALVVLIAEGVQTPNPGSSLLDYLETVAVAGRMAFFQRQRSIENQLSPGCQHLEPEEMICGSSN